MGETTKIAWADATWNAAIGCSHVSPGCEHCYAETLALRRGWTPLPWGAQNVAENVKLWPHRLLEPLKWRTPKRVFVNSMSDFFHPQIPDSYRDQMMAVMAVTPEHTYQILTKRHREMKDYLSAGGRLGAIKSAATTLSIKIGRGSYYQLAGILAAREEDGNLAWPLPNLWLLVSAEDQRRAEERVPYLLDTPAAVRGVSAEPLLGPINFERLAHDYRRYLGDGRWDIGPPPRATRYVNALAGHWWDQLAPGSVQAINDGRTASRLDWIIVGGESGSGYRPMDLAWARDIRDACQFERVAFFYKQGAAFRSGQENVLDGRTWEEFPAPRSEA